MHETTKNFNLIFIPIELFALDSRVFLQPSLFWNSIHHNAGLYLVQKKPLRENEFLWNPQLPSSLSALGVSGVLIAYGKLRSS